MNSAYGLFGLAIATATTPSGPASEDTTIKVQTNSPYFVTGDLLLKMCTADEKNTNGPEVCKDYIAGVIDTIVSNRDTIQGYQICWPHPGPDLSAVQPIVISFLRAHPEYSDGIGASVVDTALYDAYRCPGSKPPSGDQFLHKN